ncbi:MULTISPECIES: protein-disulfide reductase DsbD [unclassified Vibrio]|uniref:protein-disulfide reductase DsbD n=1 Tax=unclassified Vibrio TaxID=2614977 RepID=UPI0014822955|nr:MULTISPECIES: protein-disulfide reductase DsbD [unclassified Vibrio]NNN45752.1 protein-disulfide reductase DsbD [Vibrio sp. 1-1(7)]NNN73581.1 protein-disulfide reductase DsbD [Vibrio sp. 12-2(3-a)]
MRLFLALLLLLTSVTSSPLFAAFETKSGFDFNPQNRFVSVDSAFPFAFFQQNDQLFLDWQVKEGYYLYQDKLSIHVEKAQLGEYTLPDGLPYQDEFFGKVTIYDAPLSLVLPLNSYQPGAQLIVEYQGCAKAGFCYPPETRIIQIAPFKAQPTPLNQDNNPSLTPSAVSTTSASSLTEQLAQSRWTPLLFLLLGIGLAFTPCVLPMYPILTSIVLGGGSLSHRRALLLSFIYVQGMAVTYTLLGLVVASAGLQFQAALQHPYVLIGLSLLFISLALSMFGLYSLQLPSSLQTKLNQLSQQQQGGRLGGVFIMGIISGLVCSPCTTAPLSGALLYVAQSGDLLTGALALYALALGMGIPLILVAVFGNKLLPKAGEWMNRVKVLFGFVLLAAPIFLLERILPSFWSTILWSFLGLTAFGWLYHIKNSLPFAGWKQSLLGIIAILGLLASAQPLLNHWFNPAGYQVKQTAPMFQRIDNVAELEAQLALAKTAGKPVMLDFYADWCVACKEFEKYTFHRPSVESKLQPFILLQADVTKNQPQDIELLKYLEVLGLPTIVFWDVQGQRLPQARISGFMPEEPFLAHLDKFNL